MKKLTPRQAAFCHEYVVDSNAMQAAIRAGYSKRTAKVIGCQNLTKINIKQEIHRLTEARNKRTCIDADSVVMGILDVINDAKSMRETESGKVMVNHAAALKGLELLGKTMALFTDKKIVDSTMQVTGINIVGVDEH